MSSNIPVLHCYRACCYEHYRGYPSNRTWGILIRSAEHETANAPSGIAGVVVKGHTIRDITVDLSVDTAVEDEAQSLLPPYLGSSFSRRR